MSNVVALRPRLPEPPGIDRRCFWLRRAKLLLSKADRAWRGGDAECFLILLELTSECLTHARQDRSQP